MTLESLVYSWQNPGSALSDGPDSVCSDFAVWLKLGLSR